MSDLLFWLDLALPFLLPFLVLGMIIGIIFSKDVSPLSRLLSLAIAYFGWTIYGLLGALIGGFASLFILALIEGSIKSASVRECPACGEEVKRKARKCKHCGEALTDLENEHEQE